MGTGDISEADYGNLENTETLFTVDTESTEGAEGEKETTWQNTEWTQYLGYYKTIPELKSVIDAKANWTVGKGYKADEVTTLLLDTIKGNGFDTFNTIIENDVRVYHIGGDSYNEIIRNEKGKLINLKPLDPEKVKHVANIKGVIIRFEVLQADGKWKKFKPEEIFYLPRNRLADEIHGQSIARALAPIILMRNEAMRDMRTLMHRHVQPVTVWHLDTDDPAEMAAFKIKGDKVANKGENFYIPKGAAEHTTLSVPPNSTLSPLAWIEALTNYFYEAAETPKIIVGGTGGFTEAAVKISYLAYQQPIEAEQLFIEEQVLAQLGLVIELEFPVSLEGELLSDKAKDEETGVMKPGETNLTTPEATPEKTPQPMPGGKG